jgi:ABC-type sulfate/molybdate transport systems ATPase subunit
MPGQLRPACPPARQDVYAAAKTTLMRMIAGQEFPPSGTVRAFGQVPAESDAVLGLRQRGRG